MIRETSTTIVHDVTVIDPVTEEQRQGRDLVIQDGKFVEERPAAETLPENATIIQGEGRHALPGLIDAHIHLRVIPHVGPRQNAPTPSLLPEGAEQVPLDRYISRAQTFLHCGITSFYDAGNDPEMIFGLREQERQGVAVLPRVHATGNLITVPGGHGCGAALTIRPDEDIEQRVAEHLSHDPDVVKITYDEHGWGVRPLVPLVPQSMLRRVITAVHSAAKKVTVHVSHELRAREAVEAGADILAHPVIQSPMNPAFAEELATAQVPVVSTLAIGDRYVRLADAPDYVDLPLYRECETEEERRRLRTEEHRAQRSNRWADWMRVMTPVAQENLRILAEAGVQVAAGTDQSFGPDYHRELQLLEEAGLSRWQVLRAATTGAAAALGRSHDLGSIRPGAAADVLLVDEDPVRDLSALTRIAQVIKGGVPVDRSALDIPGNRLGASA